MAIDLKDLNPRNSELEIKGKKYDLKAFTLSTRVWAEYEFATNEEKSGLKVLASKLQGIETNIDASLDAACRVAYKLMIDKSDFPTLEDFIDRAGNYTNLMAIYKAICECIGLSEPQLSEIEREAIEVKKLQAARQ